MGAHSGTPIVLLVDDDWSVRGAVRDYLTQHDLIVVEADSAARGIEVGLAERPDVVVMDIVLPEQTGQRPDFDEHTGVNVARRLRAALPELGIVFLSAYVDYGSEVIKLFTEGQTRIVYLLKGSKPQELLEAVRAVARNLPVLKMEGIRPGPVTPFEHARNTLGDDEKSLILAALARLETLSAPEWRVFLAIGSCLTHKLAADRLGLSAKTVAFHVDSIYEKLGLREANPGLNQSMIVAKLHCLHLLRQPDAERAQTH